MSLLMHEIDGSEAEDNSPCVKHTRRVFNRPPLPAPSACAGCSDARNSNECVVERTSLVIFASTLTKKRSVNSGFIVRVVDPIMPAWFCDLKTHHIFGFGCAIVRDGLTPNNTVMA